MISEAVSVSDPVEQKQPGLAQVLLSCHNDMILLYEACTQIMFVWLKLYYNALESRFSAVRLCSVTV